MKKTLIAVVLFILAGGASTAQKLTGAGATFPYPIYSKWFSEYGTAHPSASIRYQAIGSGAGMRQVAAGLVDFGATDGPATDEQLAAARIKLIHIPTVLGAVVPIFNLPGIGDIRFSPDVLAGIFLGRIARWSDPRIAQDNPELKLPDQKIAVVHRSDGSGTSYIFTDYLTKVSGEWANGPGKGTAPVWPVGSGAKGNAGVARRVLASPGSIGYVELAYALQNKISYGQVKNASGNWVKASIEGVTAAASSITELPADYRISITNAPGADAYPISSFSWLLVPLKSPDRAKGKVLKDLLGWIVTTGQGEASALSYAPLPDSVAVKVLETIRSLR